MWSYYISMSIELQLNKTRSFCSDYIMILKMFTVEVHAEVLTRI